MSPMHSAPAAVDRELNERVSVVLLLDMQSVHEDTVSFGPTTAGRLFENPETAESGIREILSVPGF